jgi:diguanylate cyclase (GGDEF)-like protein/PAS domain S-box-containing protein
MAQKRTPCDEPLPLPQQPLLASALGSVANAIFITDGAGRIIWANPAFSRLSGYSLEEMFGSTPAIITSGMQSQSFYAEFWSTILAGNVWRGVMVDRRKDGTLYTMDETVTPLFDRDGVVTHFVAIQNDITLRKQQDERDHYLAYHDVLTGLPNRALFLDIQRQALFHAKRAQHLVAIQFLDLDKFKPVNDSFGYDVGDRLLLVVAGRLSAAIRKSDTVARFGGDEFTILLPALIDAGVVEALVRKLIDTMARPFVVADHRLQISASIGISIYPTDGEDPDELMRKADQAMYLAKNRGGNSYQFSNQALA